MVENNPTPEIINPIFDITRLEFDSLWDDVFSGKIFCNRCFKEIKEDTCDLGDKGFKDIRQHEKLTIERPNGATLNFCSSDCKIEWQDSAILRKRYFYLSHEDCIKRKEKLEELYQKKLKINEELEKLHKKMAEDESKSIIRKILRKLKVIKTCPQK